MAAVVAIRSRGGRSVVEFDDRQSFECAREFPARARLAAGQEIDAAIVERLRQTASEELVSARAERLVRRGRYSRRELAARLQQAGFSSEDVRSALDALARSGELDDEVSALRAAREGLRKVRRRYPDSPVFEVERRVMRRLSMRGFDSGTASAAVRAAWEESQAEEEGGGESGH